MHSINFVLIASLDCYAYKISTVAPSEIDGEALGLV